MTEAVRQLLLRLERAGFDWLKALGLRGYWSKKETWAARAKFLFGLEHARRIKKHAARKLAVSLYEYAEIQRYNDFADFCEVGGRFYRPQTPDPAP